MNYYISDLHLFQETSIRFDERPFKNLEEMHEIIKEKWNCKVKKRKNIVRNMTDSHTILTM